ncbi:hypothetical protein LMTR13_12745 [Bradyrhizobium icense]|uniref:Uncharacterized protein n=1 Tax=Bradyrhizobium icense TaxID=1274631 RepID=A0A1B1UDU0_9BRAD|nr:hypothetical protein [Bradyrhizobium icense]ANW00911.1 hypothetical protein LMTR13_12745 [Bradyrhizobium icense]
MSCYAKWDCSSWPINGQPLAKCIVFWCPADERLLLYRDQSPISFPSWETRSVAESVPEVAAFERTAFSLHDESEICKLLEEAGFGRVEVEAATARLEVPEPREFLWQYHYFDADDRRGDEGR